MKSIAIKNRYEADFVHYYFIFIFGKEKFFNKTSIMQCIQPPSMLIRLTTKITKFENCVAIPSLQLLMC